MSDKNTDRHGIPSLDSKKSGTPDRASQRVAQAKGNATILRVSANSAPASVAGALAGSIREQGKAEMQAIGAGAINQAVKAIAIARGYVAPSGYDLITVPSFMDVEVNGEERTAIRFLVEPR